MKTSDTNSRHETPGHRKGPGAAGATPMYPHEFLIRGGALGDFLLSLPLISLLAGAGASVTVFASRRYRALLPDDIGVRFFDIDSAAAAWWFAPHGAPPAPVADTLPGSRVHFFTARDGEIERALYRYGVQSVCFHDPRPRRPPHVAVRFLEAAGISPPGDILDRPWLADRMRDPPDPPVLWIHPGSGSPRKNQPPEWFRRLADAWRYLHPDGRIILSFGPADEVVLAACARLFPEARVPDAGVEFFENHPLANLRRRLAGEASLYVGNDSGVSHLAAAVGVPSVVLFRCTDPHIWRPLGRVLVLPHQLVESFPAGAGSA